MTFCSSWILREIVLILLIYQVAIVSASYDVNGELQSPLKTHCCIMTASFMRNNTLYFWGETGCSSIRTDSFHNVSPYFESVRLDADNYNGELIYSTVENSEHYDNYSIGASAVLLPDNERVLFLVTHVDQKQ